LFHVFWLIGVRPRWIVSAAAFPFDTFRMQANFGVSISEFFHHLPRATTVSQTCPE